MPQCVRATQQYFSPARAGGSPRWEDALAAGLITSLWRRCGIGYNWRCVWSTPHPTYLLWRCWLKIKLLGTKFTLSGMSTRSQKQKAYPPMVGSDPGSNGERADKPLRQCGQPDEIVDRVLGGTPCFSL